MAKNDLSADVSSVRILVVDDHPNTAKMLARAISQMGPGIDVFSATSGERALELTKDSVVDVLITDMVMSGMSGLELVGKLQEHPVGRPAYTILITAYDVPGLKETARRLKIDEIVIKPARPERMCEIVAKALKDMGRMTLPAQGSSHREKQKILIADDIEDNVTLLSRYMTNEGYTCVTASDGLETLELVRKERPDLVLLDVNMPVKDGFETVQEIRADASISHIPVIMLTAARLEATDMQDGLNLGADDYVTKPFDRQELMARIRTRLRVKEADDAIRRRNKELNVLPEIGRELSSRLDVNELADVVLRRTVETLGALLGHVVIFNQGEILQKKYHFPEADPSVTKSVLPSPETLRALVKKDSQGFIIDNVHEDTSWKAAEGDPAHSVAVVPISGWSDLLGFLVLAHEQIGYFSDEHMNLLQAIASQAAIAIENAQLHTALRFQQQGVALAVLMVDKQNQLTSMAPPEGDLFEKQEKSLGKVIKSGNGFDLLLELLQEARLAGGVCSREIPWPDGRQFTVSAAPIADGGCVALLYG
ncbi:MAG: response regulator [Anaerolineales bacterium]|nr:response regulator [Anaerolineales bacterium]